MNRNQMNVRLSHKLLNTIQCRMDKLFNLQVPFLLMQDLLLLLQSNRRHQFVHNQESQTNHLEPARLSLLPWGQTKNQRKQKHRQQPTLIPQILQKARKELDVHYWDFCQRRKTILQHLLLQRKSNISPQRHLLLHFKVLLFLLLQHPFR